MKVCDCQAFPRVLEYWLLMIWYSFAFLRPHHYRAARFDANAHAHVHNHELGAAHYFYHHFASHHHYAAAYEHRAKVGTVWRNRSYRRHSLRGRFDVR